MVEHEGIHGMDLADLMGLLSRVLGCTSADINIRRRRERWNGFMERSPSQGNAGFLVVKEAGMAG